MTGSWLNFSIKIKVLKTKINIRYSYIDEEPSSDSEAGVRSENQFVFILGVLYIYGRTH